MVNTSSSFSWSQVLSDARRKATVSIDDCMRTLSEKVRDHPLLGFELEMLGRLLREVSNCAESTMPTMRVAILSGFTSDPIAHAMRVTLFKEGFRAEIFEAPFGVYIQEILSPDSSLYAFDPQIILIVAPLKDVKAMPAGPIPKSSIDFILDSEVSRWQSLWGELSKHSTAIILQHTFEIPCLAYLGPAERGANWGAERFVTALNERLMEASSGTVHWVDVDNLSATVGRRNWHDPRLQYHGKFAFSPVFLPEYSVLLGGALRSGLARTRKALIVDLDNTLWGGVIGDDGLDGISLGPDSPHGEAYQAFCKYVSGLGRRGVILGICSKNEMSNIVEAFTKHPHMPIRIDEFAVVRCNWENKASNLSAIALELNIDLSAIVFVDDNPAECELVRQAHPAVYVVQMDGDPASFIERIDCEHLFDSQHYSQEDINRSKSYQARAKLAVLQTESTDLETFLISLKMHGKFRIARREDIPRLAQMEMKTNQFNVTTRRWTAEQISQFLVSEDHDVFSFQLSDCYADHGVVGSMIVYYQGAEIHILSWLMSCRVFSRTSEDFMITELTKHAKKRGANTIIGRYDPTEKNKVVVDLFKRLGFINLSDHREFALKIGQVNSLKHYISNQ
jgi:FkbH-like protein